MSVKKQVTLKKGISGEFIFRIESVTVRNKPAEVANVIVNGNWYADEEEKTANRPLVESYSFDLPVTNFIGSKNPIEQAYVELKGEGKMLEGGSDC